MQIEVCDAGPPGKKKNKDLSSILEPSVGAPVRQQLKSGSGAQKRLNKALRQMRSKGNDPNREANVVDVHGQGGNWMSNRVPCITRTRGGQLGHYVTNRKGPLTLKEMLRLQGLPEDYEDDASKVGMTPRQLGQCIGNAMSVNILTELLRSMLTAIGRGV